MTLAGKRIATYARFSTDKQSAASTADQIGKVARWCEAHGGRLSASLIFRDDAVSGAVRERPGLEALLAAVAAGSVDVLVVEDLGRLSRDTEDSAGIRKRLAYGDCRLVCIDDGIDTASDGAELMGDVMAGFKSLYRREVAKKTLRGLEGRARAGHATGSLPIGYASATRPDGAHDITIDTETAPIVREIFQLYAAGHSLDGVAAELNRRGYSPPRGGRSRGTWLTSSVRSILHNDRYIGRWSFGAREWRRDPETRKRLPRKRSAPLVTQERPELAIVDLATWDRVRERFASSGMRYAAGGRRVPAAVQVTYPLSGVLFCGCGSLMSIVGGEAGRRYYRCSAARRGTCAHDLGHIRETRVRDAVIGAIRARFSSVEAHAMISTMIAEEVAAMDGSSDERRLVAGKVQRDEQALASLVRGVERLASDAPDVMLERVRELGAAVKAGKAALARLDAAQAAPSGPLPSAEEILEHVSTALDGPPAEVREALRGMLDGARMTLVRLSDGSTVVRGGLLPDALLSPAAPLGGASATVTCGGERRTAANARKPWPFEARV